MAHFGVERRQTPRVEPADGHKLTLDVSLPVEVVDISLTGVQLASQVELNVGDRAELKATIGNKSVKVPIEIRRVVVDTKPARNGPRYRAGAAFETVSTEQRVMLEQFLGMEP